LPLEAGHAKGDVIVPSERNDKHEVDTSTVAKGSQPPNEDLWEVVEGSNDLAKASILSFYSVSKLLTAFPDIDALMRTTLEEALKSVGAERGFIALINYHTGELKIGWTAGYGWTDEKLSVRFELSDTTGRGVEGHVALTGKPYLSGDISRDMHHSCCSRCLLFENTVSCIVVPLKGRDGKTIGVLSVNSERQNAFDENDLRILCALADAAAIAISAADYHAREQKLIELGMELASQTDIEALLDEVVAVAVEILQADDCSLFLIDDSKLVLKASRGALKGEVDKAVYELGEGLTGWVALHAQPIRLSDVRSDPRWKGRYTEFPAEQIGAFLAVPIMGQKSCRGVLRVLRKRHPSSSYTNPFTPDDQNLLHMLASQVGAVLDRVELQERLIEAERMAALGEMSARTAHMLGNKLFTLKGALKELKHIDITQGEERERFFSAIESSIKEMEELLQEFRYFVKSARAEKNPLELISLMREFVEQMRRSTGDVAIGFETQLDEVWVEGDAEKLKRCISELVENATHFMPHGGSITITIEQSKANPNEVLITVSDTGMGIPEEKKEKIFEPFYSTRAQGLGLGLAIVKSIVQAHGGTIEEVGEYGRGAKFVIALPAKRIGRQKSEAGGE
jgi:signal transduction histidine kinase